MGLIFGLIAVLLLFGITVIGDSYMTGQRVGAAARRLDDVVHSRKSATPPAAPAWVAPAQIGLGALVLVLGALLLVCKRLLPIPLLCPGCEVRLDEVGLFEGHCPKCRVRLR
jgi:hypothetical protein